jgi:hypothetical protein
MSSNVILSCPFCHQKEEYRDAPPNSTVRCQECSSVFRVPANALAKHRPGTVLKGEHAGRRGGYVKPLVIVLLLAAIAASGYYLWAKVLRPPVVEGDIYRKEAKYGEETAPGVVERFMLAWKHEDTERMVTYCRLGDQDKMESESEREWVASVFETVELTSFEVKGYTPVEGALGEYLVNVDGIDKRTKGPLKGVVKALVMVEDEQTSDGNKRKHLGVDIHTAAPKWD